MTIGRRILQLRHRKGWTQKELAEKAGTNRVMISYWESEKHCPNWSALKGLCEAFGLNIQGLLRGVKI